MRKLTTLLLLGLITFGCARSDKNEDESHMVNLTFTVTNKSNTCTKNNTFSILAHEADQSSIIDILVRDGDYTLAPNESVTFTKSMVATKSDRVVTTFSSDYTGCDYTSGNLLNSLSFADGDHVYWQMNEKDVTVNSGGSGGGGGSSNTYSYVFGTCCERVGIVPNDLSPKNCPQGLRLEIREKSTNQIVFAPNQTINLSGATYTGQANTSRPIDCFSPNTLTATNLKLNTTYTFSIYCGSDLYQEISFNKTKPQSNGYDCYHWLVH